MDLVSIHHLQGCINENVTLIAGLFCAVISLLLIRRWLGGGWCYSKASLKGKTVIVTGANTGIGKAAAHDFAKRGARVIIACRDLDKGVRAAREIEKDSAGEVVVRHLDLASFKSVRKFAKDVLSTESSIHILVNNAGLWCGKSKTEDGNDLVFQTNHLGPFLLTNLLLEKLKESSPARIVNVASLIHRWGSMNWDDLNQDKNDVYKSSNAYSDSKLANVLFTKELAKKLRDTGVTAYALHPGYIRSEFGRYQDDYIPFFLQPIANVVTYLTAKSVVQGAQTTIFCAVAEEVENESGLYYSDCAKQEPSKQAIDAEAAEKLWNVSARMVGLEKQ